jgi:hypothetical protein
MKPTLGRIVIYHTTEQDREEMRLNPECNVQKDLPAIIVGIWSDECVNLKVIYDGDINVWKTSVTEGTGEYNWSWPEIRK